MKFKELAEYFDKLENTASRNEMVEILAKLFKKASPEEISFICYLLQGRVAPLFEPIEFGLADKMMIRALSQAYSANIDDVTKIFNKSGDLGITAQGLRAKLKSLKFKSLNVTEVYKILYELAITNGERSQEKKTRILAGLLQELDPLSVRYVVRIPLNKLRLGFSYMTMLDALSWMTTGDKSVRKNIEAAYNVRPDLGFIAETVKTKGIVGLKNVQPAVGTPILMARAERLVSPQEIIKKIGKCAVEYKYDGFRIQIHYSKDKQSVVSKSGTIFSGVKNDSSKIGHDLYATPMALFEDLDESKGYVRLFSRNLEDVTKMYPDIVKGVIAQLKVKSAIFEGEAIAFDPETHQFLPFQETVQRKRKYDIAQKAKDVPLKLIAFELLYVDGESLINEPYELRRKKLENIF